VRDMDREKYIARGRQVVQGLVVHGGGLYVRPGKPLGLAPSGEAATLFPRVAGDPIPR